MAIGIVITKAATMPISGIGPNSSVPPMRGTQVGKPDHWLVLAEDDHDHRRQDDELTVGEVDRPGGLPEQREADGGEGEDRSGRQTGERDLYERRHVGIGALPPSP